LSGNRAFLEVEKPREREAARGTDMKIFHCDHCQQLIFFENVECIECKHKLAYVPDLEEMSSLEAEGEAWRSPLQGAKGRAYKLCRNYSQENVCNWALPAKEESPFCLSCRLTRVIPDLSRPGNREAWYRLEVAKRRLIYSLLCLKLPLAAKSKADGSGLFFDFKADPETPGAAPVLTGHNAGVITVNLAEADDVERERRRLQMHEPYRTLLGHFRHEVGHYYWARLIQGSDFLEKYRQLFGNEEEDYAQALEHHYKEGPPADWQERFVSAYASSHPWEDWAETWAHYLHMADTLETAIACGLSLRPKRTDEPTMKPNLPLTGCRPYSFDRMIENWFSLTYVLNNLNRGLGLKDSYPFVLSTPAIEKLRFVHQVIAKI
jgi:hypothetical protein